MQKKILNSVKAAYHQFFSKEIISKDFISKNALEIIEKLQKHNFKAYIVGGAIRDILISLAPKDFDIVTNATPEEIRQLFKNSRIIGRRFRLVHIFFGRELIEVSTFRAKPEKIERLKNGVQKDNAFGTIEEDAERRDFTCNALYFDPIKNKIFDFYGGINDLETQQLKMIGDPKKRLAEDPVRAIRAIRFSAKLNFEIDFKLKQQIIKVLPELKKIPYSRIFDEVLKIFLTGHAEKSLNLFINFNLSDLFFPSLNTSSEDVNNFVLRGLKKTDDRIRIGKPINPGYLLAVFLWKDVNNLRNNFQKKSKYPITALNDAIEITLIKQNKVFPIQKRFITTMTEIWRLQPRFENLNKKRVFRLFSHPRFRAAYDFMLLRGEENEVDKELVTWWTNFVEADDGGRRKITEQ